MKRFFGFALCLMLLLQAIPVSVSADASNRAMYNTAIDDLDTYLLICDDDADWLECIMEEFTDSGYKYSEQFGYYAEALLMALNDDYSWRQIFCLDEIINDSGFAAYLEKQGFEGIRTAEYLENYIYGRQAEYEGRIDDAVMFYELTEGYYDADARMIELDGGIGYTAEEAYQAGLDAMDEGDYRQAYKYFTMCPGYGESDRLAAFISRAYGYSGEDEPMIDPAEYYVGNTVLFGHYEQDGDRSSEEPIEWIVLDRDGDEALLISLHALDARPFNGSQKGINWCDCTLREWLNDGFYYDAFTEEEQAYIAVSYVPADQNPYCTSTPQGDDTWDNVFLLSVDEAREYFRSDEERRCTPTEQACLNGSGRSVQNFVDGEGTWWWWLRTAGKKTSLVTRVYVDGEVKTHPGVDVSAADGAVRPCIRVTVE